MSTLGTSTDSNRHGIVKRRLAAPFFVPEIDLMKSLLAILASTCLVTVTPLIADAQTDPRGFIVSVGDMMPNFELADLDGQIHTNESLLGKV